MTNLSVNINKIALIRNSREGLVPDIVTLSKKCIDNGANGITVHPRSDLRHIKPDDIKSLRSLTKDKNVELNIEGNPFSLENEVYPGFLKLVEADIPDQCTLVPDEADQLTSDHGWDLKNDGVELQRIIKFLRTLNIRVSLFLDPDIDQILRAKEIGADRIELYTGPYANAFHKKIELKKCLESYKNSVTKANEIGLEVNAGHDLNLLNLRSFLAIGRISEVSIGHALISDALIYGIEKTIKLYNKECK